MRKRVKMWGGLVVLVVLMLFTASWESYSRSMLKEQVAEANKECPLFLGEDTEISRMAYDESANMVKFYYKLADYNFALLKSDKEATKSRVLTNFYGNKNDDTDDLFSMLTKANAGMQLIYTSASGADEFEITITPDEIRQFLNNPEAVVLTPEQELENLIAMENAICPYEVEQGLFTNRVYVDGDDAVYECLVDETRYDIDVFQVNIVLMKESIREASKTEPVLANTFRIFAKNNKNLIYRYKGDRTGKTADVVFTAAELKKLVE